MNTNRKKLDSSYFTKNGNAEKTKARRAERLMEKRDVRRSLALALEEMGKVDGKTRK